MPYICDCCEKVFDEPVEWEEDRGECFGFPSKEIMDGSPCCHERYTEAVQCFGCGEWVDKYQTKEGYCKQCAADVVNRYRAIMVNFSQEERNLLFTEYEGDNPFKV